MTLEKYAEKATVRTANCLRAAVRYNDLMKKVTPHGMTEDTNPALWVFAVEVVRGNIPCAGLKVLVEVLQYLYRDAEPHLMPLLIVEFIHNIGKKESINHNFYNPKRIRELCEEEG